MAENQGSSEPPKLDLEDVAKRVIIPTPQSQTLGQQLVEQMTHNVGPTNPDTTDKITRDIKRAAE